jgi:hypothetical protein
MRRLKCKLALIEKPAKAATLARAAGSCLQMLLARSPLVLRAALHDMVVRRQRLAWPQPRPAHYGDQFPHGPRIRQRRVTMLRGALQFVAPFQRGFDLL